MRNKQIVGAAVAPLFLRISLALSVILPSEERTTKKDRQGTPGGKRTRREERGCCGQRRVGEAIIKKTGRERCLLGSGFGLEERQRKRGDTKGRQGRTDRRG